ncbi:DNA-protecting protein DprA [Rhodobacteraceae bacterium WD3A24]|nr:DNA-protecting protein DprA [Rhodobacteraceae bacterium WD3A24]
MAEDLFSSPTPFTPPTTEEDRLAWLGLIRSRRVGVSTFYRLMAEHGDARSALAALPEVARAAGVRDYSPCPPDRAAAEIDAAAAAGARMIALGEAGYPAALATLPDAPPILWAMGDTALLDRPMIAMVGARNASSLGTRMARKLAEGLGEAGFVVVSGLARGIDAAAHHAALDIGTVAVQGGGVDVSYPTENAALCDSIGARGLRLSEQPMGMQPQARHFPRRNRIIAGLARAVVVVEAAARSGSLITARDALDCGREVAAVPGHPMDPRATGCNILIRDGATLVRGTEDVLAALSEPATPPHHHTAPRQTAPTAHKREPREHDGAPLAGGAPQPVRDRPAALREVAALHGQILDRLGPSPVAEDQLIRDLALPAARIGPELVTLELEGRITRQPGGMLSRAD